MEMSDKKSFRESFDNLVNEMSELIKNAPKEDLEKAGIATLPNQDPPKINPEPKTNKEFIKGLLTYCTGSTTTYILQKADLASALDIEDLAKAKFSKVIFPTIVKERAPECTFRPYIVFFTPHGSLAMLPYHGHEFSDMNTPVGLRIKRKLE